MEHMECYWYRGMVHMTGETKAKKDRSAKCVISIICGDNLCRVVYSTRVQLQQKCKLGKNGYIYLAKSKYKIRGSVVAVSPKKKTC